MPTPVLTPAGFAPGQALYTSNGAGTADPVSPTNPLPTSDTSYATRVSPYYQVTVTSSAQALSALIGAAIPSWATAVRITPENGTLRYRCDGSAPTALVGQPIYQQQAWTVAGSGNLAGMQLILAAGQGSRVNIEFLG